MATRKRKRAHRGSPDYNAGGEAGSSSTPASISTALFVQAHEATVIHGKPDVARALTTRDYGDGKGGLIQWQTDGVGAERGKFWVDRYDARLLLTSLPSVGGRPTIPIQSPPSPTGWSDLPSDSEDTFFFSPGEIEDLQREKRRKLIDAGREERLRAMRESDPDPSRDFEDVRELWGDDNEEPEDAERNLMERTAKHLLSSPNPGQLEMRILANHGSDQRFAFLRGRWRNTWQSIQLAVKAEKDTLKRNVEEGQHGGLVAYGDSGDDESEHSHPHGDGVDAELPPNKKVDDKEKETRRARAREWAQRRKEKKD